MSVDWMVEGPDTAPATIVLAHGAGAPMDSASMAAVSAALSDVGLRVLRFEFAYMAARRHGGTKKPPPRAETLIPEYIAALEPLAGVRPLIIGGKSMGGRVASMVADRLYSDGTIAGLLCLGYPFHPPAKPNQLRTRHLVNLQTPTLICQGTRDPFGTREDVAQYELSSAIEVLWLEDGDHDLKPRKAISGFTAADHLAYLSEAVHHWIEAKVLASAGA